MENGTTVGAALQKIRKEIDFVGGCLQDDKLSLLRDDNLVMDSTVVGKEIKYFGGQPGEYFEQIIWLIFTAFLFKYFFMY